MICKSQSLLIAILFLASAILLFATSNGAWMAKVPSRDRSLVNPYRDQPPAIAAGHRIFLEHCAQCHGKDALGTQKRPSLRSARVQQEATEGDLHWLLENGSMRYGMPVVVGAGRCPALAGHHLRALAAPGSGGAMRPSGSGCYNSPC